MKKERSKPPQFSLILRLLCGGYLLYTAWGLREAFQEGPYYIVFAIIFAGVGLALAVHSIVKLVRKEYTENKPLIPTGEDEESKDCEEQSDE